VTTIALRPGLLWGGLVALSISCAEDDVAADRRAPRRAYAGHFLGRDYPDLDERILSAN